MGSPGEHRLVLRVIIRVIVLRDLRIESPSHISLIFRIQRHAVIFRMAHNEYLPSFLRHAEEYAGLAGIRKDRDPFIRLQKVLGHFRMSGMRRHEYIVKSPDQWDPSVAHTVTIYA